MHQMMLMDVNRQNPVLNLMPSLSLPQQPQRVLSIMNQQLDMLLDRRRTSQYPSSSSSLQCELYAALLSPQGGDEVTTTYTPPRRQQQQQIVMRNMFGPPPPLPVSDPGVGRPPGSSTDFVHVPVSGSPVRSPSLGASPISVRGSSGKGSPISVRGSSGKGSPHSWPSPPP